MDNRLLKNTFFNFIGQIIPIGIAIICIPMLVKNLGVERVGLLTIIWVIVGYFSILDFGLGFAVTKTVSEAIARKEKEMIAPLFWGAVLFQFFLALIGGMILFFTVPAIVQNSLKISIELVPEAKLALYFCALAIPLLLISSSVVGLLHAAQRFDLSVKIQVPLNAMQYLLPLVFSFYSNNLGWIVAILLVNRFVGILLMFFVASSIFPQIKYKINISIVLLKDQLIFGGWITLSNVLSPIMVYLDRFIIGALMSVTFVAYYAVPLDAVMKLSVIPNSLSTVLFSAFSYYSVSEKDVAIAVMRKSFRGLLLVLVLPISVFLVFSKDVLHFWLGSEFVTHSALVLQILLVGIWANSLTRIPFVYITSNGRADIVAKVQMIQTPIQIALSYIFIKHYGLPGAAVVWSSRLLIELVIYIIVLERISGKAVLASLVRENFFPVMAMGGLVAGGLCLNAALTSGAMKISMGLALLVLGGLFLWNICLVGDERVELKRLLARWG